MVCRSGLCPKPQLRHRQSLTAENSRKLRERVRLPVHRQVRENRLRAPASWRILRGSVKAGPRARNEWSQ